MSLHRCSTCKKFHDLSKISLSAAAPDFWDFEEYKDAEDCHLTSEQCYINNKVFFIRGNLDVPIRLTNKTFRWGVWTTLSRDDYAKVCEYWDDPDRNLLGPHFGWLSTTIPGYSDTVNLKCLVHHQKPGERPIIKLRKEEEHLLCRHFFKGVPIDFLMPILHPYFEEQEKAPA